MDDNSPSSKSGWEDDLVLEKVEAALCQSLAQMGRLVTLSFWIGAVVLQKGLLLPSRRTFPSQQAPEGVKENNEKLRNINTAVLLSQNPMSTFAAL